MGASCLGAPVSVVSVLQALARRALKFGCPLLLARSPALLPILTGDFSYPFNAETLHSGRIATSPHPRLHFGKLQLLHAHNRLGLCVNKKTDCRALSETSCVAGLGNSPLPMTSATVPNFVPSGCLVTLVSRRAAERETRINTREAYSVQAALNR